MDFNQGQKLPVGLAGVLNGPDEHRDSAYYSTTSKHNSTQSHNGMVHTPGTDTSSAIDKTPSPISTGQITQPLNSPASGGMSITSMVSPTSPTGSNCLFNRPSHQSYDSARGPLPGYAVNGDSRRESVDGRLAFGEMRLGNSPYGSQNASTTSLQSTLAQQRNPGAVADRNSTFRMSNHYQPHRQPGPISPRTAPTITGPALGDVARAPEPTKGQAWAFPEEPIERIESGRDSFNRSGTSFLDDSRRNSIADSIASSQYTTESRLPHGQRRLEDGVQTHHHSLQNRQLSELQDEEGNSPGGSQPYSRTPELRVSHKLAERKRRTEMKELFDTLNARQHHDRGSKASKWEILTKAISEDERKDAFIKSLQEQIIRLKADRDREIQHKDRELENLSRSFTQLQVENAAVREQIAHGGYHSQPPNAASGPPMNPGYGHYDRAQNQPRQDPFTSHRPTELPPLRNINGSGPESMNGVQYQQPPVDHRLGGFRAGQDRF